MSGRGEYGNELVIGRSRGGGHRGGGGHHGGHHGGGHHGGHHGGGHHGGRGVVRYHGGWDTPLGWGSPYYGQSYGWGSPYYGQSYGWDSPYYGQSYGWPQAYEHSYPDYLVDVRQVHALMGAAPSAQRAPDHRALSPYDQPRRDPRDHRDYDRRDHRGPARDARDHRGPARDARDQRALPPPSYTPPSYTPPSYTPPPAYHPPSILPSSPHWWPPAAHQQHGDYISVEGYGWYPRWYPYWEPYWYGYWQSLYSYYGGDANPQYAEYARDVALRTYVAPQRGWL